MVKCNFCEVDLKNSEVSYTCGHNICNICLSHELLLSRFKSINDDFTIDLKCLCGGDLALPVDQFYILMTKPPQYSNSKTCTKHSMPYNTYCKDCSIWLCEECKTTFHNDYFVEHLITNKGPCSTSNCFYHKANVKNLYCKTCNELICETCAGEETHGLHLTFSIDRLREKKEELKKTMQFKSYSQIEEFISENERNIIRNIIKRMTTNNKAINQAIKALNEIKTKHFSNTEILLKKLSDLFKIAKQCYRTYYDELDDKKAVLASMEFIFKIKQELNRINYEPIIQNELEKVNEMVQEVSQKSSFFKINFIFKGAKLISESSISTDNSITSLCAVQDKGIACGMQNGKITIYTYRDNDEYSYKSSELTGHLAPVNALTLLVNNSTGQSTKLASGSSDHTIRIWNYIRGECLYDFNTIHKGSIWDILELQDGRIVSSSSDNTIKIWRIEEPSDQISITQDTIFESSLCIVDDNTFASGSGDGVVKLWDNQSAFCNRFLIGHKDYISCLVHIANGIIASGSADTNIIIWNTIDKSQISLSKHKDSIQRLMLFNDKYLASCSKDNTIIIWDLAFYESLLCIEKAHMSTMYGLIKTTDAKIISGGNDNIINIWDSSDLVYE